ncbi:MAG: NUDIX domain-containing protein [Chloroflexi bacterium]|nr:NUDIX domain-containing protein [Chloroflexota bacterium]
MTDPLLQAQAQTDKPTQIVAAERYFGGTKEVSLAQLRHRVSVYAVIVEQERMLMIRTHNRRYYFPGGGMKIGETLQDAVKREAQEELNAEIQVGALLHADDVVYYHDPVEHAVHLVRLYYECQLLTRELTQQHADERDEILSIDWVPLDSADPAEFLPSTWGAFAALRRRLGITS